MIQVVKSNRAEILVETLAEVLAQPLSTPFAAESVIVQGRGMERWVSLQLAKRLGVCANVKFPFPRKVLDDAFTAFLGDDEAKANGYKPEQLIWSIARQLLSMQHEPAFAPIAGYLASDVDHRMLIQLARQVADLFDRYAIHRPEMVLQWEHRQKTGLEDGWQASLWRALVAERGASHTASRTGALLAALERGASSVAELPERLCFFGTSSLPPIYLRALEAMSERIAVHMFVLTPSKDYWADLRARRVQLRVDAAPTAGGLVFVAEPDADLAASEAADGEADRGGLNPLLSSFGRLHRDFQELLEICTDYDEAENGGAWFVPERTSMLSVLQADIAELVHRSPQNPRVQPLPLADDDVSITIHACHSPMRELEVLHDQLVACFEADETLQPSDVVVMVPAVDEFAPGIEAIFGSSRAGAPNPGADRPIIPYQIADRSVRSSQPVAEAFAHILDTLSGRATASGVIDVLELELVRRRFGLSEDDLVKIRSWIVRTGIRWGQDADHRAEVGQPAFSENTWRFGLDRLLLGYSTSADGHALFGGVAPFDDIEGSDAEILGKLASFCEVLFGFRRDLGRARTASAWTEVFAAILAALVHEDDDVAAQHQRLRDVFVAVGESAQAAGFDQAVALSAVRAQCEGALESGGSSVGFLTGGVTFCQLMPMRSIPFRVVCLVGMSDGAFPRVRPPLGFDLMAQKPALGDRTIRNEDRYLFLEALLSTRERLIVTYVGQSVKNNAELPPSVLVGELLDRIEESFVCPPGHDSVRKRVVTAHPLQPFSPRYFDGTSGLFAYSSAHRDGAAMLQRPRCEPERFVTGLLADADARLPTLSLDDLYSFFKDPAKVFCEQRIGLHLSGGDDVLADREPVLLDGLETWAVGAGLLDQALAGAPVDEALAFVRAQGVLPLGAVGEYTFENLSLAATNVVARAGRYRAGERLADLPVDLALAGVRVTGVVGDIFADGRCDVQFTRLGRHHELRTWIYHLALCATAPHGYPTVSRMVGRAEFGPESVAARFSAVDEPATILSRLVEIYLDATAAPLPLFAKSSRLYVEELNKKRLKPSRKGDERPPEEAALSAAATAYGSSYAGFPDLGSPYVAQLFGDADPLDPGFRPFDPPPPDYPPFAVLAESVFAPLLSHREDEPT